MAEQVTEVAYIPLVPDTDPTTGDAKKVWDNVLQTIASQPGCKSIYWGRQVEKPDVVQFIIEWGALADHKAFEASPAYPPFLESFAHLLSAPPTLFHLLLPAGQFAAGPGPAPTTECISLFFDPAHDAAAYDANWAAFASAAAAVPSDCKGIVGGWGVEPHEHEKLGAKEGEKGPAKFFGAFIGWPSVESHMEFREKEEFPQIIKFLREGPVGIAVHHVRLQKYL